MNLIKSKRDKYRGKYSSLAKGERGQIVNLSAPIGEGARSAVGEISRRGKKAAFTLAEVLITIGIIGVVSALTIPTLMAKITEKQTVTKLRATQSILYRAIKLAEDEEGDPSCWGLNMDASEGDAKIIAKKMKKYLKIAIDCGTSDTNGMCIPNDDYKKLSGGNQANYATMNHMYKVKLLNGTSVFFRSRYPEEQNSNNIFYFFVDTNGKNPPNTFGIDLFAFTYNPENNGLIPAGSKDFKTTGCFGENSIGLGCAYYVLQTGKMDYLKRK